jgi:hypothetical protein
MMSEVVTMFLFVIVDFSLELRVELEYKGGIYASYRYSERYPCYEMSPGC